MFWGLPMRVAADPALEAHATARRKGTGSSFRFLQAWMSTGGMARQTMSFMKTAESAPVSMVRAKRRAAGESSMAVTASAARE